MQPRTCMLSVFTGVFFVILRLPVTAEAASFNCSQARSTLEVLICADAELSSLDGQVGEAYSKLRSSVPPGSNEKTQLLNEQRGFLKKRTEACPAPSTPEMITCLKGFYTLRLNALQKQVAALANQNPRLNRPPLPTNGFQGQTGPDGKEVDVPSDLVATLQNDLDDPDYCSEQRFKECVRATWFDLTVCDVIHDRQVRSKRLPFSANRPQQAALLVEELSPSQNWVHLLYIRAGNGWRKIFDDVCQDSLIRTCTSTHGLPDLKAWVTGGANSGSELVYQFDGNVYKMILSHSGSRVR
jgi:uncharacterized protein